MDNSENQSWAYILENPAGRFYVGSTEDLPARIFQHNDPEAGSTKYCPKNGPWKLVWKEAFATRSQAMRHEKQMKRMKSARWIRENLLNR